MAQDLSAAEPARRLQERVDALSALSRSPPATMALRRVLGEEDHLARLEAAGGSLRDDARSGAAREEPGSIDAEFQERIWMAANPHSTSRRDHH